MKEYADHNLSNVPELSVSEMSHALKKTLEETYSHVRVRGELSRVKIHTSGHMYSDLKDENSVINLVCWRGNVQKLQIKPEEGLEVICTGRISSYPARSNYQLIVETMELAGEGALLKMLEERRKKLAQEGLFDESRKKKLPFLPEKIGVITSPTGAVIRDIMHRLNDRFPRHVLLYPVLVQGPGAAEQIESAIKHFNLLKPPHRPDLLIVARGGGSLEDLMAFNEESVVRAAAQSDIPLISAVGHETDTTLIDYVSDLRAPTPTGAAEKAVPNKLEILNILSTAQERLQNSILKKTERQKEALEHICARLKHPEKILEQKTQMLDFTNEKISNLYEKKLAEKQKSLDNIFHKLLDPQKQIELKNVHLDRLSQKLGYTFRQVLTQKSKQLLQKAGHIRKPSAQLNEKKRTLENLDQRLKNAGGKILIPLHQDLSANVRMLESLSFKKVLARGYAVIRDENGQLITQTKQAKNGQKITITLQDGDKNALITPNSDKKPHNKTKKSNNSDQKSLF